MLYRRSLLFTYFIQSCVYVNPKLLINVSPPPALPCFTTWLSMSVSLFLTNSYS